MRFYYDFEQEKYVSEQELLAIFEQLKTEQPGEYNYSFQHFKMNCMSINNGSLHTLAQRKAELSREYFTLCNEEYDFEIDCSEEKEAIEKEIAYIDKLENGEA